MRVWVGPALQHWEPQPQLNLGDFFLFSVTGNLNFKMLSIQYFMPAFPLKHMNSETMHPI